MPWLAQVPTSHPFWAEPGSEFERVLLRLDYVETRAPGTVHDDEPAEPPTDKVVEVEVPVVEQVLVPPVRASPRRK